MFSVPSSDQELLQRHLAEPSGDAFAVLVGRHLDLVYAAALRQLSGDRHAAEDAAQAVFVELARRAGELKQHPVLVGWLYTTTRYVAQRHHRDRARRQTREHKAQVMHQLHHDPEPEPDWTAVRPVLDDAMQELREADRLAVLLRFFERRDLRSVGDALGVSPDAARMRIDRALERLRSVLAGKGITATAAALSAALPALAQEAAPVGLLASVTGVAVAQSTLTVAAASGAPWLAKLSVSISAMKTTALITVATAMVVAVPLVLQHQRLEAARAELDGLRGSVADLDSLRAESARVEAVSAVARELESLRLDEAELGRLRAEADALRARRPGGAVDLVGIRAARRAAVERRDQAAARHAFRVEHERAISELKHVGLAARIHATSHGDRLPTTLDELKENTGILRTLGDEGLARFEYFPQPRAVSENEPQLFLFRERQPRQRPEGGWERGYTRTDGSVVVLESPDDDFAQAEIEAAGVATASDPNAAESPDKP